MHCYQHLQSRILFFGVAFLWLSIIASGQPSPVGAPQEQKQSASPAGDSVEAPSKVNVSPVVRDEAIRGRLQRVLEATGWFEAPQVRVQEGVVFFRGTAASAELKEWASDLARNTQDVVAVANEMRVREQSAWDFRPAGEGILSLWQDALRTLPALALGVIILALSIGAGLQTSRMARVYLRGKIRTNLLRNVVAMALGGLVVLLGTYIVLRVSGLTQLAMTVLGGTGLLGLAVGIAFREITENFLASIVLSMQRPFETGDLVEVSGVTGYVHQLNVRTTILMTLDGNLVQIPNATIYRSNLRNFTTTPNRREDFVVGIGYEDSISEAQEIASKVLKEHPAVIQDPEPSVLVDSLGQSTVNLRVYFWLNGREHSWLKVRSSVIRMIKVSFQEYGISMPDEAREVVFPKGIPISIDSAKAVQELSTARAMPKGSSVPRELIAASTQAEGGLHSEAVVLQAQAKQGKSPKQEENLLTAEEDSPRPS